MTEFKEIRKLFDIWDNSFGVSEDEIIECEKRLGKRLPEILRQYYLQLGNNEQINQSQNYLVLPSELKICENNFLDFHIENQSVCAMGINVSDFRLEDPPLYVSYDSGAWFEDDARWEFFSEKLSDFLISMAHLQAIFGFPFNAIGLDEKPEKEKFVRENWKKINLPISDWSIEFFQNESDELLALTNSEGIDVYIATKTEEKFHRLDRQLSIEWSYNSLED